MDPLLEDRCGQPRSVLHDQSGEMTSRAIAGRFGCSWPTTSQHLGVLQ
jgi:hypothetical protein